MASGGIGSSFSKFATKGGGKEATSKDVTKWLTDGGCMGKNCSSNNLDIAFSKVKPKGKTTITMKELEALINELATAYGKDKKIDDKAAAAAQLKEKLAAAEPKAHGATKTSKTGGVEKMTDASKYTGAHKERFGADGKGKGIDGREDRADNSGYVGNYKGKDTYDKK